MPSESPARSPGTTVFQRSRSSSLIVAVPRHSSRAVASPASSSASCTSKRRLRACLCAWRWRRFRSKSRCRRRVCTLPPRSSAIQLQSEPAASSASASSTMRSPVSQALGVMPALPPPPSSSLEAAVRSRPSTAQGTEACRNLEKLRGSSTSTPTEEAWPAPPSTPAPVASAGPSPGGGDGPSFSCCSTFGVSSPSSAGASSSSSSSASPLSSATVRRRRRRRVAGAGEGSSSNPAFLSSSSCSSSFCSFSPGAKSWTRMRDTLRCISSLNRSRRESRCKWLTGTSTSKLGPPWPSSLSSSKPFQSKDSDGALTVSRTPRRFTL
mmetsp:Transcript_96609/g.288431  ORF Transcript_96609/g.288431 Transcript_96609/m.288431 type:complete len:324 (+) Transcript_96609:510-1481(+)